MPTYDYLCNSCDHRFELFQSIKASAKRKCPECGRLTLRRLIGPGAAIIFKGSGFYQTDYRSGSYKKGADGEKKAGSNGDSKAETHKSDGSAKSQANASANAS